MRVHDLTRLELTITSIDDAFAIIEGLAHGKTVLNVGAAGGISGYLPDHKDIWLHHRLEKAAASLVGTDIDQDGIDYAARHGIPLLHANCEHMDLGRKFDLIVLSDVIEHLDAPVVAIRNLARHLKVEGVLCMTTPNANSILTSAKILAGKRPNIYWDHVACYAPEHIQAICDRCQLTLEGLYAFNHQDQRSLSYTIKSRLASLISRLNPGLATSFLAVIKNNYRCPACSSLPEPS